MAFFLFVPSSITTIRAENDIQYAKIISSDVKLYRSISGEESYENIFFTIPQSYYVILTPCDSEKYYTATYIDVQGYVKRDEVQCVSGIPTTPFAQNINFRTFIPNGIGVRLSPDTEDFFKTDENNLIYYGSIKGEQVFPNMSSIWYYCKQINNGEIKYGYVYSEFSHMLSPIPQNTEILQYIDKPSFEVIHTSTGESSLNELSALPSVTQIIIIVAVCLPCVFIIYLLFKPTKITAKAMEDELHEIKKSKKTKSKHNDYYEYKE